MGSLEGSSVRALVLPPWDDGRKKERERGGRARETGGKRGKEERERRGQRKYTFVRGGYVSASFLLLGRTGKPFR